MQIMEIVRYWMSRLFDLSPSMIILAVIGSLLAAFTLIIYGFLRVLAVIWDLISSRDLTDAREEKLSIEFIELIDVFLIGVILLIVALSGCLAAFGGWRFAKASAPVNGPIIVVSVDA